MRILTVKQPWAWAIVHAGKDVENRGRNLAGDYRGPLAIHAGLGFDFDAALSSPAMDAARDRELLTADALEAMRWDQHGVIIGVVDLVSVHLNTQAEGCIPSKQRPGFLRPCSEWSEPLTWHLCLSNPRQLSTPIPWKGSLGMLTLPDHTTQQIQEQLT